MKRGALVVGLVVLATLFCIPQPVRSAPPQFSVGVTSGEGFEWPGLEPGAVSVEASNSLAMMNLGDERSYSFQLSFGQFNGSSASMMTEGNMVGTLTTEHGSVPLDMVGDHFEFTLQIEAGEAVYFKPTLVNVPELVSDNYFGQWELKIGPSGITTGSPDVISTHIGGMGIQILPVIYLEVDIGRLVGGPSTPVGGYPALEYGVHNATDVNVTSSDNNYYLLVYNFGNVPIEQLDFAFDDLANGSDVIEIYNSTSNLALRHVTLLNRTGWFQADGNRTVSLNGTLGEFGGVTGDTLNGTLPPRPLPYLFEVMLNTLVVPNATYVGNFSVTAYGHGVNATVINRTGGTERLSQMISINVTDIDVLISYADYALVETMDTDWLIPNILASGELKSLNVVRILNNGSVPLGEFNWTFGNFTNGVQDVAWTGWVEVVAYGGGNVSITVGSVFNITNGSVTFDAQLGLGEAVYLALWVVPEPFVPTVDFLVFQAGYEVNITTPVGSKALGGTITSIGQSDLLEIYYVPQNPHALIFPWFGDSVQASNTMLVLSRHFSPVSHLYFNFSSVWNGSESLDYEVSIITHFDLNPYDLDDTKAQVILNSQNGLLDIRNPVVPGLPFLFPGDILTITFYLTDTSGDFDPLALYNGAILPSFSDLFGLPFTMHNETILIIGEEVGIPDIEIDPSTITASASSLPGSYAITLTAMNKSYDIFFEPLGDNLTLNVKVYADLDSDPILSIYEIDEKVLIYTVIEPTTLYIEITIIDGEPGQYAYDFTARRGVTTFDNETLLIDLTEVAQAGNWGIILLAGFPLYVMTATWLIHSPVLIPQGFLASAPVASNKRRQRNGQSMGQKMTLELKCGEQGTNLEEAIDRQAQVVEEAKQHGIDGYTEQSFHGGAEASDAYLYPTIDQLPQVIKILEKVGWTADNLDVPASVPEPIFQRLKMKYYFWNIARK